MPSMQEIYNRHSSEYDELVSHEDYKNNLKNFLLSNFDFPEKTILEFGAGTGRTTGLYIDTAKKVFCCDNSDHMLEKAKINLSAYNSKINYFICDNLKKPPISGKADIIIEGWSFGHTIVQNADTILCTARVLVNNCSSVLKTPGTIIIIETMGTDVETPQIPGNVLSQFYYYLEKEENFGKKIIATDYKFENYLSAARIMGYFFGDSMKDNILKSKQNSIKEFTGIWYKTFR